MVRITRDRNQKKMALKQILGILPSFLVGPLANKPSEETKRELISNFNLLIHKKEAPAPEGTRARLGEPAYLAFSC